MSAVCVKTQKTDVNTEHAYMHEHTHTHTDHWCLLVWGVICRYHCNCSNRGSFPTRKQLNVDHSLLPAASPSNHSSVVRRRPDRLQPLSHNPLLLPSLNFSSELIPELIPSALSALQKNTQILINRPLSRHQTAASRLESPNKQHADEWVGLRSCDANPQSPSSDRVP